MKTIIAEKPSVAREIARIVGATKREEGYFEGGGYAVTWAFGHLVQLAMPDGYGVRGFVRDNLPIIPDTFTLVPRQVRTEKGYKPDSGVVSQIKVIKRLFDASDQIIVATDAGREGELIFRYLYHYTGSTTPFVRLWISSLTDKAIREGLRNLEDGGKYDNLYLAAKARSESDWLVGINGTQALSIAAGHGTYSVGRVQTPTLAMVCERYWENRRFTPEAFWQLHIATDGCDGKVVKFSSSEKWKSKEPATELYNQLIEAIKQGNYQVQPILGIEIPKGNGKTRLLGVPTTTERVLQQALAQTIAPLFEPEFSNYSYGFRPHKNARQAVGQSRDYIHSGLNHIVDIDLKNFFDEVDHCLLLNLIYQKVKCKATMQLIRKWLRAPIKINGKLRKRRKGVPQGSPLSPLLSNILLHQLDKEMTRRGHKFVRYADDFSIYCKSHNQAKATRVVIEKFLKNKLKLTINEEKSGIRKPIHFTILGFGFVPTYEKGSKNQYQLIVSEKAWKKLKERLKTITRKTTPATFEERIAKIKEVQRGWLNYFQGTSILGKLRDLDGWLRNRLRYCIWHHWKKPERKRKNLIRLGVDQDHAYAWSRTRKGGWAIAQSPILGTTITLQRLKKRGYVSLTELHLQLNPSLCEPPST